MYILAPELDARNFSLWHSDVLRIKQQMEFIISKKSVDSKKRTKARLQSWLQLIDRFVDEWGKPRVPVDIRSATIDAQKVLCLQETEFGPDNGRFIRLGDMSFSDALTRFAEIAGATTHIYEP